MLTVKVEEASDQSVGGSTPSVPPSRKFSSSERLSLSLALERTVGALESQEQQSVLLCFPCRAEVVGVPLPPAHAVQVYFSAVHEGHIA